jgi:hypothetical protein
MTRDFTPEPDHTDVADHALEGWVSDLGMFHASRTELAPLVDGSFDRDRSFRTLWHLRRCATCREQLAACIEEVVLDEQDVEKSLGLLTGFLQHQEPMVRAAAARAAVTLSAETTPAIELVRRLLHDGDELVRSDAAVSLSQIEGATGIASREVAASIARGDAGLTTDDRGRGESVEPWSGLLSRWFLQPAVAGSPLAAVESTYEARRSPLESLFTGPTLEGRLSWAKGPLRIGAFYDDKGEIQALRAIVGRQAESGDALIVLELSDAAGATVSLTLSANEPSRLQTAPDVRGRLENLHLKLSVADLK